MATKYTARAIKSLFQDAMIRIPYFISTTPTNTVAMSYSQTIEKVASQSSGYLCKTKKLYYEGDMAVLTLLIVFDSNESAQKFYTQHNDFDAQTCSQGTAHSDTNQEYMDKFTATYQLQGEQNKQLPTQLKARIFYCRDISELEAVLFERWKVSVQFPSRTIREVVVQTARMIVIEGIRAEEELKSYISQQPVFQFLDQNVMSSESIFYRWRVYSYLMGDGEQGYRMKPFEMIEGGVQWQPPSESVHEKYAYRVLNAEERQYFTCLVEKITTKKSEIEQAMFFCLQNISASIHICCIIAVSFSQLYNNSAKQPKQSSEESLPLMYLISDILFNSTNTIYRDIFSVLLPNLLSKFTREGDANLKLIELLKIWQKKFIFEEDYFKGLFWSLKTHEDSKIDANIAHSFQQKDDEQIEELSYRYGICYLENEKHINKRNLMFLISNQEVESLSRIAPEPGVLDGEELTDRDINKIKTKSCRAIACSGATLRSLFDKTGSFRFANSASIDKE